MQDQTDPTFVSCNICQVKISQGETVSSMSMTHHLKSNHFNDWEKHVKQRDAVNMEKAEKMYEPEGSAWQYFEKDSVDTNILVCQVGECTFQVICESTGTWSEQEIKEHLYTHGYREKSSGKPCAN